MFLDYRRKHANFLTSIILTAAVALPVSGICGDTSSNEILTLNQAISIATTNNRLLKNAKLDVDNAHSEAAIIRTKMRPQISLTAAGSQLIAPVDFRFKQGMFGDFMNVPIPATNITVSEAASFSVIANATIMQPITQIKRIKFGAHMQDAAEQIAVQDWKSKRNELVSNVKQLYYGLIQIKSSKDTVDESIKFLTELERFVDDNVKQGTALDSDLMEVQARLAKQRHELSVLNNSFDSTREKLNVALGRDVSTEFDITSVQEAASAPQTLAQINEYAMCHRPEVIQAELKTKIARYDQKSKQSEYKPDVSLGLTYTKLQNIDVIPQDMLTAGVIVTWNEPFNWGKKKQECEEKAKIVEQADNGLNEAKSQIEVDVNSKYRDLQDALSQLDVDRAEVNAKQEKRRITMNRYKENASLLKDVLEADTDLSDANRQYIQDQLAVSTARAKLDQAIGEE